MLHQIIEYVENYLAGRGSSRELESWLVAHLQEILDSGDQTAIAIADEIDADLVYLGERLVDEEEFRARLKGYLRSATAPSY